MIKYIAYFLFCVSCIGQSFRQGQVAVDFVSTRQFGANFIMPFQSTEDGVYADYIGENKGVQETESLRPTASEGGMLFDGDAIALTNNTPCTSLSIWVKHNGSGGGQVMYATNTGATGDIKYAGINDRYVNVQFFSSTTIRATSQVPIDTWTHVYITDGSVWINGEEQSLVAGNDYSVSTAPYIGSRSGSSLFFKGILDDIVMYPSALPDNEIIKLSQMERTTNNTNDAFRIRWNDDPCVHFSYKDYSIIYTGTVYTTNSDQRIQTTGIYTNGDAKIRVSVSDDREYDIETTVTGAGTNNNGIIHRVYDGEVSVVVTDSVHGLSYGIINMMEASFANNSTTIVFGVPGTKRRSLEFNVSKETNRIVAGEWNVNGIWTNSSFKTLATSCNNGTILIGPDIGLSAAHCGPGVGTNIIFIGYDGGGITCTVTAIDNIGSDILLIKLDDYVDIQPAQLFPADWQDYFPTGFEKIPFVALYGGNQYIIDGTSLPGIMTAPTYPERLERYYPFTSGSGSFIGVEYMNRAVLSHDVCWTGGSAYSTNGFTGNRVVDIQTSITDVLGSTSIVETADFSTP